LSAKRSVRFAPTDANRTSNREPGRMPAMRCQTVESHDPTRNVDVTQSNAGTIRDGGGIARSAQCG
jgi:hypothetical protein